MAIKARDMCCSCYEHQRFAESPTYAESRHAQQREMKRQRRLEDEEYREKQRAIDRARAPRGARLSAGPCRLCGTEGRLASELCPRCYNRTYAQERRTKNPESAKRASEQNTARARRNYEVIRQAKDNPCVDCGGRFPIECMDFDHIAERGPKLFSLSKAGPRRVDNILAEIAKCDLICANCHRIRTRARAKASEDTEAA